MGQIAVVTSLKGGVGKTLFSSSLALESARSGKRVLAVDMDLGTGGLDIAMGREDAVIPTFLDLALGSVSTDRALIPGDDGVYFLSAPVFFNETDLVGLTQEAFDGLLAFLKENFDLVIFDMPAGGGAAFRFFEETGLVDRIILVTTGAPTSVRAAERCAMRLKSPEKCKLVLNSFRITSPKDNTFGVTEVIERASVPIIGVVPFDPMAEKALARGIPMTGLKKSPAGRAVANIFLRLTGESVPLLDGVMARKKRIRFY